MSNIAIVIRHYNGDTNVPLPEYPSSYSSDDNFTSVSFNDISGTFHDKLVCYKKKFIWKFDAISGVDLNRMYYGPDGIIGQIKKYKSRIFGISSNLMGMPSGLYYLGTPSSFNFIGQSGDIRWYTGELHWIEVDGVKLNSIVANDSQEETT